jgi:drug/metabolite transporter (DMT)-like permease
MGVFLGLLAGFTYGAADFIGGLASRKSTVFSVVVVSQAVGLVLLLAIMPLLGSTQVVPGDILWGSLAGVAGALGISLLYRGLAIGRMSLVSPITAVIAAVVPFVTGLAMHEHPSSFAIAGVLIALVAVVLVSSTEMPGEPASNAAPGLVGLPPHSAAAANSWLRQPGLIEAVLSGIGIGFFYVFLAHTRAQAGMWPLAASRFCSAAILIVVALAARRSILPSRGGWSPIAIAGLLDMFANACYLLATRHGLLAIVAVLASLYPASTVMLARLVLHEKLSRTQLTGVGCALVAIALIAVGSG